MMSFDWVKLQELYLSDVFPEIIMDDITKKTSNESRPLPILAGHICKHILAGIQVRIADVDPHEYIQIEKMIEAVLHDITSHKNIPGTCLLKNCILLHLA